MGRVLLALVSTLFLVTQVMAGAWTANNFLYQPATGARGGDEKAKFDLGLNRVDSRLANEKWLNDSLYNGNLGTAITAIGSTKTVLSIPAGNWPIAANLTVPANLTLKFAHGALLTIATGKTLTINGPLEAGRYQIFAWTGTGTVVLGSSVPRAYVQWWGVSSLVNSTDAVNAALASLSNGIVDFGSDTILIDGRVNWDISKCAIQGDGAKLDATRNTGIAVSVYNNSSGLYDYFNYSKRWSGGFEIKGDRVTNPASVGMEIGSTIAKNTANFYLRNVSIHNFYIDLHFNPPAWATNWFACSFDKISLYDATYGVKAVYGGERNYFNECTIHDNINGFYVSQGDWTLNNCNLDFNHNRALFAVDAARIELISGHIESSYDVDYWIYCTGGSSRIRLIGTSICNGSATPKTKEIGLADQCGAEGIVLDGVGLASFTAANYGLNNLIKVTDYTGKVSFRGILPFVTSPSAADTSKLMLSSHLNYLLDGGFETAFTKDWTVSSGAGYVAPVLYAAEHHGGAQSLQFAPTAGNRTQIIRSIPCRVGEWGRMSFWIKNNFGASTDTFRIEAGYLAADGSEVPYYSNKIDLTGVGTHYDAWTQLWITAYFPAPSGTVSAYFKFMVGIGVSDGIGKTWVDDVQINMWLN